MEKGYKNGPFQEQKKKGETEKKVGGRNHKDGRDGLEEECHGADTV